MDSSTEAPTEEVQVDPNGEMGRVQNNSFSGELCGGIINLIWPSLRDVSTSFGWTQLRSQYKMQGLGWDCTRGGRRCWSGCLMYQKECRHLWDPGLSKKFWNTTHSVWMMGKCGMHGSLNLSSEQYKLCQRQRRFKLPHKKFKWTCRDPGCGPVLERIGGSTSSLWNRCGEDPFGGGHWCVRL